MNRKFTVGFSFLTILTALALLIAFVTSAWLELGVFYGDGELSFSVNGRMYPVSVSQKTPPITEIPRETPNIIIDNSGREKLPGNEIYKKISPSVVGIISKYEGASEATGTGTVVSEDGIIITNHHVVSGASVITVVFEDGMEYSAKLLGDDYYTDLAAVKINASGLIPAELGSSEVLEPGDNAYVIGNPLGFELWGTITNGIISAINRDIQFYDAGGDLTMTVIQTNCAVNPGNSGGPLINEYGQVVGIISSKIMGGLNSSVEGLGFAIPVSVAKPIIDDIVAHGYITGRPAIGITADPYLTLDENMAERYGIPVGVFIESVNPKSDAAAKNIQKGDIITHVNGKSVKSVVEVNEIKNEYNVGDELILSIYRSGERFDVSVVLVEAGLLN